MNTDPIFCDSCGAALDSGAPGGLCPRCLMAGAMQPTEPTSEAARQPAPSLETVQAAFPQLEVLELVGQGGMGWVFKARQPKLNRLVALKLLPSSLAERDPAFAERFAREGQLLARLHHPNIVAVHDSGTAGEFFYLLMEFVEGVNLREAMRSNRFTPAQALAIVPRICDALQFAHDEGVLHRDIKPENILLDGKGRVKLADFGIAKLMVSGADFQAGEGAVAAPDLHLTQSGTALGTPSYMAPEQRDTPGDVDHRADIYSLGVVFYELLTGELPLGKFAPPSEKSAADPRLDGIVQQALEKERDRRQQSVGEMRTQVETVVSTPGSSRREEAHAGSPSRFLKVGASTLTTPELLATADGQFFAYRTRGQLILDDRQLTHSRAGTNTVIPLTAIRDLSIGRFPRAMAPAGCDLLSVTYEEGGQRKQVLLFPMAGWFGFPSTVNAHVAEWFAAIREAVTAATGRAPASTSADRLNVPSSSRLMLALVLAGPLFALLVMGGLLFIAIKRQAPGAPTAFPFNINPLWVAFALAFLFPLIAFGLPRLVQRRTRKFRPGKYALVIGVILAIWLLVATGALLLGVRRDHATRGREKDGIEGVVHSGPPFVAALAQGSVELLALAPHPSARAPSWLPDGSSAKEPFPGSPGHHSAAGRIVREIAVRVRSRTGTPSDPVLRFDQKSGVSGMGSSLSWEDQGRTTSTFVQAIACLPEAKKIDLKVGVAEGVWQTALALNKPTGTSPMAGNQTSGPDGMWEAGLAITEGKSDVALAFHYAVRDDFETRMIHVKGDGTLLPLQGTHSQVAAGLKNSIVSMTAEEYSQIKEFQLQKRRYQWVEFRNVSLQLGNVTSVEMTDAPGAEASQTGSASSWPAMQFNPNAPAMLPKLQMAKSATALQKLKSKVVQQEAALKAGKFGAADLRATKDKTEALDAELEQFKAAWHKFELALTRHETTGGTYSQFAKAQNEVGTAEVRLRAVQAAAESGTDGASFGPVMERLVPASNEGPCNWFDVERARANGKAIIGRKGDDHDSADFAAVTVPGRRGLITGNETGFGSIPLEAAQWDTITPGQLAEQLKSATVDTLSGEEPLPKTYGFITRAGGMGILQITGLSDTPSGLQIRYRLVQNAELSPASSHGH